MTKLSHLHFVSNQQYARRVMQLGEESWRVYVCGALSLDNLRRVGLLDREEFERRFGIRLEDRFLLVTFHPVTLEYEQTQWQVGELLAALAQCGFPTLFTMPNADTAGRIVRRMINDYVRTHPSSQAVENLGTQGYFSAMALASAMVGNSSSGIIEAAMFNLPVVNVGSRQRGRIRSANIVDVDCDRKEITRGIEHVTSSRFAAELESLISPYGDGHAAERIVDVLRRVELNDRLLIKGFCDYPPQPEVGSPSC
jgi:UDP-hydrolysing UDP-N-acetyl-D-glucosamine 2-epimerase